MIVSDRNNEKLSKSLQRDVRLHIQSGTAAIIYALKIQEGIKLIKNEQIITVKFGDNEDSQINTHPGENSTRNFNLRV